MRGSYPFLSLCRGVALERQVLRPHVVPGADVVVREELELEVDACGLERIDEGCFQESGLEELQTPQSLREIGSGAFYGCARLKKVWLNEGLKASADTFRGCASLETV